MKQYPIDRCKEPFDGKLTLLCPGDREVFNDLTQLVTHYVKGYDALPCLPPSLSPSLLPLHSFHQSAQTASACVDPCALGWSLLIGNMALLVASHSELTTSDCANTPCPLSKSRRLYQVKRMPS